MEQRIGDLLTFTTFFRTTLTNPGPNLWEIAMAGEEGQLLPPAWITVFVAPPISLTSGGDPIKPFKATYLGSAKPPEKEVVRNFFGQDYVGHYQQCNIPTKLVLEAFLALPPPPLTGSVFIGLRRLLSADPDQTERFFAEFCASLAVVERKWSAYVRPGGSQQPQNCQPVEQRIEDLLSFTTSFKTTVTKVGPSCWEIGAVGEDQRPFPAWVTVFVAPPEALTGAMGDDPIATFKATNLGAAEPPEKEVVRHLFGQDCKGHAQLCKVPFTSLLEVFQAPPPPPLTGLVFIGLRMMRGADPALSERFFAEFCASLAVVAKKA